MALAGNVNYDGNILCISRTGIIRSFNCLHWHCAGFVCTISLKLSRSYKKTLVLAIMAYEGTAATVNRMARHVIPVL